MVPVRLQSGRNEEANTGIRFRVLGPIEADIDGRPVALGGPKPRALLAVLLANRGRSVSMDSLISTLWSEEPPPTAAKNVQKYVSQLRKEIGPSLLTREDGYAIVVSDEGLDAARFQHLAKTGTESDLTEALALWRDDPYPELVDHPNGQTESARLIDLKLTAEERLIELQLERGLHVESIGRLEDLVHRYPYREHFWGQLMLSLYRSGRQTEALDAFQRLRTRLGDELGIEPSTEVKELEERILLQDPGLILPRPVSTNLPAPRNRFIGRIDELSRLTELLDASRLVTLLGPAGSGKTRLSIELGQSVNHRFPDGVWFVDLTPVRSPDYVVDAVAAPLGVGGTADKPAEAVLAEYLKARSLLLVIDNCEHVVARAASVIDRLLKDAPRLVIVTTSRERLGVEGEQCFDVAPLPYPEEGAVADEYDAVRLFIDRAQASAPGLNLADNTLDIGEIVRRLDGIPLAIELAAARVRGLGLIELKDRLDDRFALLTSPGRDTDSRHQTLQAAVEWSYQLLSSKEKTLFRRLSVFRGGFTLGAVTEVCGFEPLHPDSIMDLVTDLVDKSLVVIIPEASARPRYTLSETLREYGRVVQDIQEPSPLRKSHASYFFELATEAAQHLRGPDQAAWLTRLSADHDNLRKALRWADETDPQMFVRMAVAMARYWDSVGPRSEGHEWLRRAVETSTHLDTDLRIDALLQASDLYSSLPASLPRRYAEQALEQSKLIGDISRKARSLRALSWALAIEEKHEAAVEAGTAAVKIFERLDDAWELALGMERLALASYHDPDWSITLLEQALGLYRETGDRSREALVLYKLADRLAAKGKLQSARASAERAVALCDSIGGVHDGAHARLEYGKILRRSGEADRACEVLRDAFEQLSKSGDERCSVRALTALGTSLIESNDSQGGATALCESLRRGRELDEKQTTRAALAGLARLMAASGRESDAISLLSFVENLGEALDVSVSERAREQRNARLVTLKDRTGPEAFRRSWEKGSTMTLDEAISLALDGVTV
jgi:predicted ATPase/DNA-binding SARP family transcriptional activator